MKIAFVMETMTIKGGLERVMADRMNALAAMGHEILLVEVYDFGSGKDAYEVSESVRRIRLHVRKRCLPAKIWQFRKAVSAVRKTIESEKPDIMTSPVLLGVILYGLSSYSAKMVYESHVPRHIMPFKWLVRRMERRVDAVVTLTIGDASEYKTARRTAVIPNYTDIMPDAWSRRAERRSGFRAAALGRLCRQKDFLFLLQAWKEVVRELPQATLDIYGDGPDKKKIERRMAELGLEKSVTLRPATDDTDSVYRSADIVVMSSRYEGFPMVGLEALSHGVCMVAVDVSYGPREMLEGGSGVLVKRSVGELARGIITALSDRERRETIARKGLETLKRYSKEQVIRQWKTLFEELAQG